ncbi:MAG: IPT/TIG domain-containing protein [Bryobacteraceae bacterium]
MPFTKNDAQRPLIEKLSPAAAIPGGDVHIHGQGFVREARAQVSIGGVEAQLVVSSDQFVVARVPETEGKGRLTVSNGTAASEPAEIAVGTLLSGNLHPVARPAVDHEGNVYTTFSGSRGQKTAVAVYTIDTAGVLRPFVTELMNATGLAFNRDGVLHVSSRFDGVVYQASRSGELSVYVEGMGVATGIAFDSKDNLYVGDRAGTVFKIGPERQIYVFATLEASIAAYHLAFGVEDMLFVTGPTTSSYDAVQRITPSGEVEVFYRGLGRPQGMDVDRQGNLYVAASLGGRKGIVRITPEREATLFLSGPNIVGLAFAPGGKMIITTTNAAYSVPAGIDGLRRA